MVGQYPLKAMGELNRALLSGNRVAHLNATVSQSEINPFIVWPPPNNVLNVTMHGMYNPPLKNYNQRHMTTGCSAVLNVPAEIHSVKIISV